jgi:hypothetical protein
MLPPEQRNAFNAFYDSVRDESVLDKNSTIMIGLAAAMAAGCDP